MQEWLRWQKLFLTNTFLAKSLIHEWKISGFCGIIVNFRCHDKFTFLNWNMFLDISFHVTYTSEYVLEFRKCIFIFIQNDLSLSRIDSFINLRILAHTSYSRMIHNEPTDEFHSLRLEASTSDASVLLYPVLASVWQIEND